MEDVLNGRLENGLAGVRALLALPERPTALVCFNDMYAVGALHTLKQAGFRVPDDCAVVGFDNIPLSALVSPALTTFDQPKHAFGREAAHMMLGLSGAMPGSASDPQSDIVTLRGEIFVRDSTAPPPS